MRSEGQEAVKNCIRISSLSKVGDGPFSEIYFQWRRNRDIGYENTILWGLKLLDLRSLGSSQWNGQWPVKQVGLEVSDRAGIELESRILSKIIKSILKTTGVKEIAPGEYEENKGKFNIKIKRVTWEKKSARSLIKDDQRKCIFSCEKNVNMRNPEVEF